METKKMMPMKMQNRLKVSMLILAVMCLLYYYSVLASSGSYYASLTFIGVGSLSYLLLKEASDIGVGRNMITLRAESAAASAEAPDREAAGSQPAALRNGRDLEPSLHRAALVIYEKAVNTGDYVFSTTVSGLIKANRIATIDCLLGDPVKKAPPGVIVTFSAEQDAKLGMLIGRYSRTNSILLFSLCTGNLRCEYASGY